ncbi:DUF1302 domain-containing protein [Acidovorax sp. 22279]|uniref:DUF1302 domain-containing protein n=1 Tax=Acidovorax sp. 22279 TaxID=3453900 RepID=UPI003F85CDD9
MNQNIKRGAVAAAIIALCGGTAHAVEFSLSEGAVKGSWTTDLTIGGGLRLKNPSCALTGDPNSLGCGAAADTQLWSNGDDGNLNYRKGQFYSLYSSATSELLLNFTEVGAKVMMRGTALYDAKAASTRRTPLSDQAEGQIVRDIKLLDLWAEKSFDVAGRAGRVRVGNQVINWGESYFLPYGINSTNSLDFQRYSIPGQQLKQIIQPAPMISVLSELGSGVSAEAYYQFRWNKNSFAPVGSYWSASDVVGKANNLRQFTFDQQNFNVGGRDAASIARGQGANPRSPAIYGNYQQQVYNNLSASDPAFSNTFGFPVYDVNPEKKGDQYGIRLAYKPSSIDVNLGLYYLRYTDKTPVFTFRAADATLNYLKKRDLFGLSANFPLGDWAIGTELSYRPRDAIGLTTCFKPGGPLDSVSNAAPPLDCPAYRDNKKWQLIVNAQYNLSPTTTPFIGWLGASSGYFLAEAAWINYPGVNANKQYVRNIGGVDVMQAPAAGGLFWYDRSQSAFPYTTAAAKGTANSFGGAVFFSLTYDGTIIPGWQVTPSIYHQQAISGYTPSATAPLWMKGVKATTIGVTFAQNPANWQAGINYVKYWGGTTTTNPYSDRDTIGFYVTRTF